MPAAAPDRIETITAPEPAPRRSFVLSIDTGGTFTDGFVSDGEHTAQVKVDTTPHDLTIGFAACIEAAAAAVDEELGGFLSSLAKLHFSSTVATNTIVQRRGAAVGLIVTRGAESTLYGSAAQTEALREFIAPDLVRGVAEQTGHTGAVTAEPTASEVESAVRDLLERGVRLLVISFANAHLNPANELLARSVIDRSYPRHYLGAVPLLVASRVSLAPDDFGRTATAVINAYLHPRLARALYHAEDEVRDRGLRRPLLIVNTDGSTSRVAKTRAIDTYDSGPSAGVLGASYVAPELGARQVCTFDVGGTTTDVAFLHDAQVPVAEVTEVGTVVIPHPSVALASFGLGGGSIISVDEDGAIQVGPDSAGASPGPACYGLGGRELTPTDVWLLLGYLAPGEFLGGRRTLDPEPARAAAVELADRLGAASTEQALLQARAAIHGELSVQLARWATRHPELTASETTDRWLFSYGGGGGLLCVEAAEILEIPRVVVFPHSSVFSAFGAGLLPVAHSYEGVVAADADAAALAEAVARMADSARRDLRAEGVTDLQRVQATVRIGAGEPRVISLAALLEQSPTSIVSADPISEATRCRLAVSVAHEPVVQMIMGETTAAQSRARQVHTSDGPVSVPIVGGLGQAGGETICGPAFLEAPDTTILVPPGWSASFSPQGYGVLVNGVGA